MCSRSCLTDFVFLSLNYMVDLASILEKQPFWNEKWAGFHFSVNKVISKLCKNIKTEKFSLASNVNWKQITLVLSQGDIGELFWHIYLS